MGKLLVLSLALSAGLGTCLHGYNAGVISHIIANKHFLRYFGVDPTSSILGAVVSVFAGGAVIGSLASGFIIDYYGRKITIQVGAVISILGVMLQSSAVRLSMILIGRIVSGFAIGMMSVGVPVYLTECAHVTSRGFILGFVQLMILIGFVCSAWVGYAAHTVPDSQDNAFTWRFPIAIAAIPAVFICFALQWLPESPRFLIRQGMTEQAYRVMMKLYHDGSNRANIQKLVEDMTISWKQEVSVMRATSEWVLMFRAPSFRRRLVNSMLPSIFTQLTGINIITYYQNRMYAGLGVSDSTALLLNAAYHMVAPISTLILILFIVDSVGRKKPLLYASVMLPALFVIYAILSSQNEDGANKPLSSAGIAIIMIYNIVFSFSFGPIGWIYISEVLPLRIRGKGSAVAIAVGNWTMNVIVSQISPEAMEAITWKYYIVYAALMLFLIFPCIWFFVKEPKRIPLEQMERIFGGETASTTGGASARSFELSRRKTPC